MTWIDDAGVGIVDITPDDQLGNQRPSWNKFFTPGKLYIYLPTGAIFMFVKLEKANPDAVGASKGSFLDKYGSLEWAYFWNTRRVEGLWKEADSNKR